MSTPKVSVPPATGTRSLPAHARPAAALAACLLLVNGAIGLSGADLDDHTRGLGLMSEVTAGLAFLSGAVTLALAIPVAGWRAWLWWLAPVGMAIAGATMVGVPLVGSEPAEWLFLLAVTPTFVGQVAAGLLGTNRRWPWWVGAGLALQLPIMFLVPLNSFVMGAAWAALALTLRGRPRG